MKYNYKSGDVSEKLFRGDKSYLGNRSLRVQSDEAASAKIFVEFVALIVRSRMYIRTKIRKLLMINLIFLRRMMKKHFGKSVKNLINKWN